MLKERREQCSYDGGLPAFRGRPERMRLAGTSRAEGCGVGLLFLRRLFSPSLRVCLPALCWPPLLPS